MKFVIQPQEPETVVSLVQLPDGVQVAINGLVVANLLDASGLHVDGSNLQSLGIPYQFVPVG